MRRLQHLLKEWIVSFAAFFDLFFLIVVFKFADNLLLFVLGENFNLSRLLLCQHHPRIRHDLLRCQTLVRVNLEYALQQAQGRSGDLAGLAPRAVNLDNLLLELGHVGRLEWHRAKKHSVQNDAGTPDIRLEATVAASLENLGRNVRRRTALLGLRGRSALHELRNSKVADLDVALRREQYVIELDVPM